MNVDKDPRILGTVGARELDGGGISAPTARKMHLVTGRVELGATSGTRDVKRDDLGSDEIITSWKIRGNFEGPMSAINIQHLDGPIIWVVGQ